MKQVQRLIEVVTEDYEGCSRALPVSLLHI